jgi:hypothetical protein
MNTYEYFNTIVNTGNTTFDKLSPQIQQQFLIANPQQSQTLPQIPYINKTDINSLSGLPQSSYNNLLDNYQIGEQQYSKRIKDDYKKCGNFPVIIKNGRYFTYQLGSGIEIPLENFPLTNCGGENPQYQMDRDTNRMSYLPEIDEKMKENKHLEMFSFLPPNKNYPSLYPPIYKGYYQHLSNYNIDLLNNPPQKQYKLF